MNEPARWPDRTFLLALLLGPVCWIGLLFTGMARVSTPPDLIIFLKLAVLMPVLEEIVFRGGIQNFLFERRAFSLTLAGISIANLLTSILFALTHLLSQPPLWAALVFLPSLVFGWARDRYQRLLPCVLLHSIYNAGFIWLFVNTRV